jgi:DNA-binding response OmpR family regulator
VKIYNVLLIEDNEDITFLTRTTLEFNNYNVITAQDGKEGLSIAEIKPLDLIILDVMMPEMDGYDVLKLLKSNDKTRDIPVVMFSAKAQKTEIEKGLQLGAEKYFTKPFDPLVFLNEINIILQDYDKKRNNNQNEF